jgi:PAS domain-containing protein
VKEPLELHHSWPLLEQARHFELGHVLSSVVIDLIRPIVTGDLAVHHAGCWECDLADDSLLWSGGVYDLFGLPRAIPVTREHAVSFYCENSRAAMERLRSHAIRYRRGFTLDAEIRPAVGGTRWMRLVAAPTCNGNRVTGLHGLKLAI